MNTVEVASLVTRIASRFGDSDPQQYEQLVSRLGKVSGTQVAEGLLQVFTHGAKPPEGSAAQELAGRLLVELNPKAAVDLRSVLRASLARYELSVEQFPYFLRSLFGVEPVLAALHEIELEPLTAEELRALQTMRFWLGGRQNGA